MQAQTRRSGVNPWATRVTQLRVQVIDLKTRLQQGEIAARNGNVFIEKPDKEEPDVTVFYNPFDGALPALVRCWEVILTSIGVCVCVTSTPHRHNAR